MGFACEEDARRVLEVLPKRFGKYGLTHPSGQDAAGAVPTATATGPPATGSAAGAQPGSFDFLGFTHYWGGRGRGTGW